MFSVTVYNANPIFQLLYTTQSTLAFFAVNHGQGLANNGMTDAQRAALDVNSEEYDLRYVFYERRLKLLLTSCQSVWFQNPSGRLDLLLLLDFHT